MVTHRASPVRSSFTPELLPGIMGPSRRSGGQVRRFDMRRRRLGRIPRTTQVILGERQALEDVLRLLRSSHLPSDRHRQEEKIFHQLIQARTAELDRINPDWDRKVRLASSRKTPAQAIRRLAKRLPREDFYLARLLSDHPNVPSAVLARLARHPYAAVRENVARHPKTPVPTLRALARDTRSPLWYLVAFNPSAPEKLRHRLRERMRRRALRR